MPMTIEQLEAEIARLKAERDKPKPCRSIAVHWCPAIGDCVATTVAIPIDIYNNLRRRFKALESDEDYRIKRDDGKNRAFAGFCGARMSDNFDFGEEENKQ